MRVKKVLAREDREKQEIKMFLSKFFLTEIRETWKDYRSKPVLISFKMVGQKRHNSFVWKRKFWLEREYRKFSPGKTFLSPCSPHEQFKFFWGKKPKQFTLLKVLILLEKTITFGFTQ